MLEKLVIVQVVILVVIALLLLILELWYILASTKASFLAKLPFHFNFCVIIGIGCYVKMVKTIFELSTGMTYNGHAEAPKAPNSLALYYFLIILLAIEFTGCTIFLCYMLYFLIAACGSPNQC